MHWSQHIKKLETVTYKKMSVKYAVLTTMLDDDWGLLGCHIISSGNHSTSQGSNIPEDFYIHYI
jgi:hypothetical protein